MRPWVPTYFRHPGQGQGDRTGGPGPGPGLGPGRPTLRNKGRRRGRAYFHFWKWGLGKKGDSRTNFDGRQSDHHRWISPPQRLSPNHLPPAGAKERSWDLQCASSFMVVGDDHRQHTRGRHGPDELFPAMRPPLRPILGALVHMR